MTEKKMVETKVEDINQLFSTLAVWNAILQDTPLFNDDDPTDDPPSIAEP